MQLWICIYIRDFITLFSQFSQISYIFFHPIKSKCCNLRLKCCHFENFIFYFNTHCFQIWYSSLFCTQFRMFIPLMIMHTVEMQSNKLASKEVIILTKLCFYHVILFTKTIKIVSVKETVVFSSSKLLDFLPWLNSLAVSPAWKYVYNTKYNARQTAK